MLVLHLQIASIKLILRSKLYQLTVLLEYLNLLQGVM